MTDTGTIATDRARSRLEIKLKRAYRTARKELEEKLEAYAQQFAKTDAEMRLKLDKDQITPEQYKNWKKVAVFRGDQWRALIKQSTQILSDTNGAALRMVNNDRLGVFATNANYQSYQICRDTGMDLAFAVYDEDSVRLLLKDNPDLLPSKYLDKRKDGAWITGQINTAVTQSIIQGESIPATALRIAKQTGETNEKAMVRFARTAMTSAQNAGRMESLHRATDMGISVKKVWLATLDRRTRDSHRHLDGQTKDIDEPFISDFGKIMFPGDPEAHPGDTFNCRCTLTYEYEGYPAQNAERREEGGGLIADTTYDEWVKGKDFYKPPKVKPVAPTAPAVPTIAGVAKGQPMTHAQADTGRVNPNFYKGGGYHINCQSCVATYEARMRGYDVEVVPNDKAHPMCATVSRDTNLPWKEKNGEKSKPIIGEGNWTWRRKEYFDDGKAPTPKRFKKLLLDTLEEGGRYTLQFKWKGVNSGHIVMLNRDGDNLVIYDPQSNKLVMGQYFDKYLEGIAFSRRFQGQTFYKYPCVTRVDDKDFDFNVMNQITKKVGT